MPAGKQAGDYSPIVQLSPISNINKVALVGDIDITNDSTKVKKIPKIGFRLYWGIILGGYLVRWGTMMWV